MPPKKLSRRKGKLTHLEVTRSTVVTLSDKVERITEQMQRLLSPAHPSGGFQLCGMEFSEASAPAMEAALR
eukprot:5206563-Pleurochrysis_carterae.AAC.1